MCSAISRHSTPIPVSLPLTTRQPGGASSRPRSVSFAPAHLTLPRLTVASQTRSSDSVAQGQLPAAKDAPDGGITLASVGQQFQALKQHVTDSKQHLTESLLKAEKANVYPAKRAYWQKAGALMASLGTVTLFAALTISTGGLGPAIALGAACVMAAKTAADTRCAFKDLKNKLARQQDPHAPLPFAEQPLGGDAIGNWVCQSMLASAKARPGEDNSAAIKDKARQWSLVLNSALKVVTFSASGVVGMAMGKAVAIPLACIGMSLGAMAVAIKVDQNKKAMDAGYKNFDMAKMPVHFEKLCDFYVALAEQGQSVSADAEKMQHLTTGLSQAYLDLQQDLNDWRQSLENKAQARADKAAENLRAAKHGGADAIFDTSLAVTRRAVENTVGKGLGVLGGNAEAAASMVSATKALYMTYRLLDRVEQRTEPLVRHAVQITSMRERLQWMAV